MGSFSLWHWLVLLIVIVVPLLFAGMVWLIVHLSRRKTPSAPPGIALRDSTGIRLQQLQALLEAGHISRDEHDRQRAAIIAGV